MHQVISKTHKLQEVLKDPRDCSQSVRERAHTSMLFLAESNDWGAFRLAQLCSQTRFIGVPVAINSLGLRGDEVSVPKPPRTIRIVAVGDSITFGYGIPVEDTYAKILERCLNQGVFGGARYEVLNGGTLGGSL